MNMKTFVLAFLSVLYICSYPFDANAQHRPCSSENEGERLGPYLCEDGRWVYVGY